MRTLIRLIRVVAAVAAAILAVGGAVAAVREEWPLVAAAGLLLVFLTFGLVLHLHRKVGNAARSSSRERTRAVKSLQGEVRAVPGRVSAAVAEAVADEGAAIAGRLLQHADRLAADVAEVDQRVARVHDITARSGVTTDELNGAVGDLGASIARLRSTADEGFTHVRDRFDRVNSRFGKVDSGLYRLRHEPVTELDAMHQLRERVPLKGARPTVWGWALSPRSLLQLVDRVERHAPRVVVECGSGLSSIYVGTMLRDVEGARVVALEHEERYAVETRRLVAERGLDGVVDIRDAPLRDVEIRGTVYSWYDIAQLEGIEDVDLVLVDGPPKATGEHARYPALPLLADRLAAGSVVIMDDTHRTDEELSVNRWLEEYPLLQADVSTAPDQTVLVWDTLGRLA